MSAEAVQLALSGMCGTAAVVVKVNSIRHGDTVYDFNDFDAWPRIQMTDLQVESRNK